MVVLPREKKAFMVEILTVCAVIRAIYRVMAFIAQVIVTLLLEKDDLGGVVAQLF